MQDKSIQPQPNMQEADLKQRLLQAAIAIVEKEGFRRLTVRSVTASAGCAVGMLYKAFENLDDLALHVNAITMDRLADVLAKPCSAKNPSAMVTELAERYIEFSGANFPLWSMLFEHRMDRPLPDWFKEKIQRGFAPVERAILPLAGGDARKAAQVAQVLWAGLHGICSLSISGKLDTVGAKSASILAADLVENYLAGLKTGGKTRPGGKGGWDAWR